MIVLPEIVTAADLVALGCLYFAMVIARWSGNETRMALYCLIAVVLTDNPSALVVVPLLAMSTQLWGFWR